MNVRSSPSPSGTSLREQILPEDDLSFCGGQSLLPDRNPIGEGAHGGGITPPFQRSSLSMVGLLIYLSERCLVDWISNALTTQHFLAVVQTLSVFVNLLTLFYKFS